MSWLLSTALLASMSVTPVCSWDRPGHRAFMGDVVAAVDHYTDIPADVRARLKQRMAARRYDDIATIARDSIAGRAQYEPELRDMHFAEGGICATVTRQRWPLDARERGLVYCESGHCIIVPTVCRNVARITRLGVLDRVGGVDTEAPRDPMRTEIVALPPLGSLPTFEQMAVVPPVATLPEPWPTSPLTPIVATPADPDGGAGSDPLLPTPMPSVDPPSLPPQALIDPLPIPEPATWLMWLVGLAIGARALRRR